MDNARFERPSRLLPLAAPLVIIAGALAVLVVAGMELFSAARAYVAGDYAWSRDLLVHFLLASAVSLIVAAILMTQRALLRIAAAEKAVRESEERMRLVANNVPALISYVDRDQRYRFSNRTYNDWFGIPQERMQGRTVAEVFGAESYAGMKENIARVLAGEEVEIPDIKSQQTRYDDLVGPVKMALDQEKRVTDEINALFGLARERGDYSAEQFLTWFVKEQVEEVATMNDLLTVVTRARDDVEVDYEVVAGQTASGQMELLLRDCARVLEQGLRIAAEQLFDAGR